MFFSYGMIKLWIIDMYSIFLLRLMFDKVCLYYWILVEIIVGSFSYRV